MPRAFLAAALTIVASVLAEARPEPLMPHVRPLDGRARRLVQDAIDRSPTVANLIKQVGQSDVVIYVTTSLPYTVTTAGPLGTTRWITATAQARFLRVWVDLRLSPPERIATLGHELQHVLEIAASPQVQDEDGFRLLYRHIGMQGNVAANKFETEAACEIGRLVRQDVLHKGGTGLVPAIPVGADARLNMRSLRLPK